jgi:hypothetical protein
MENIFSYTKYHYYVILWCSSRDIYSSNSSLRATEWEFYAIKQLWRLCQSLCCLRPASASSIRLCLTLFPTLFLCFSYYNILCVLWSELPGMLPATYGGSCRSRCSCRDLNRSACLGGVGRRNNLVVVALSLVFRDLSRRGGSNCSSNSLMEFWCLSIELGILWSFRLWYGNSDSGSDSDSDK